MTISYRVTNVHWNYFIALERDFETLSRYIEPCEANNNTFSLELARIIMTATQEVDVVMKLLCKILQPGSNPKKIGNYFGIVQNHCDGLLAEQIRIPRFGMSSQPWKDWTADRPPLWWQANNKIKHQRSDHFDEATLKNAFNALGGLMVAVAYYYNHRTSGDNGQIHWVEITDKLMPMPILFRLNPYY